MEYATPVISITIFGFILFLLKGIEFARKNPEIFIRRVPGIDAIEEAIGRSVELGRPIVFTTGLTGVGPTLFACIGVLQHIAKKAAIFGQRLLVPCRDPEVLAITENTIQEVYRQERKSSRYDPDTVRFLSSEQFAYASGYIGLVQRERAGSAFLFGEYAAESLILAEAGQQVGAMQVAATTSNEQIPFFLTTCDYTLFGEELFAAGAFLSRDPIQVGSLKVQDTVKILIALTVILGVIEATLRSALGLSALTFIQQLIEYRPV